MRTFLLLILSTCLSGTFSTLHAQTSSELDALRAELAGLREEYETRIAELEQRLDQAERRAEAAPEESSYDTTAYAPGVENTGAGGSGLTNPDIGVIFQGQAWTYKNDPDDHLIPGFPLGGEAGLPAEGFSLGEIELNISANVDDKFTAWLTAPLVIEDGEAGVEIEEAWVQTLSLPAGLSLKMGRFFSNIGYLNEKHAHSWDFADQPLVYQAFLGDQYIDDGLQFRWLAPTEFYFEIGAELLRGNNYPAGGTTGAGLGSYTLHARTGGDVGVSNSWQAGISYLQAEPVERSSGDEDEPLLFTGDTDMLIGEFVWKWAPNGNYRQRNLVLQAEYMWRNQDGVYQLPDETFLYYDSDQQGWYLQAVFQPIPRWRIGARYGQLSSDHPGGRFTGTDLVPLSDDPRRSSLMADWSNSEFSRLRLQYMYDQTGYENDHQLGLQYIFSIGAHGAHSF